MKKPNLLLPLWLGGGALLLCSTTMSATPDPKRVVGIYDAVGMHRGTLEVSLAGSRMRVELRGGASTSASAPIAGDCEAVAEGMFEAGVLKAHLIPFEGEVMSLDSSELARMRTDVIVRFSGGVADVEGSFSHCGLGSALHGKYKKTSAKKPAERP